MVASPPVCSICLCIACTVPHKPGFGCRWEHIPWHVSLWVMQAGEEKDLSVFCESCVTARIRIWPFLRKNEGVLLHYKGGPCVILDSSRVLDRICFSSWSFLDRCMFASCSDVTGLQWSLGSVGLVKL